MSNPKFRLAIVGGGIGGLTLAIALTKSMKAHDQQIHIDLYESAQAFTEIGAGVVLWRRPIKIMQYIGVLESLKVIAEIHDDDDLDVLTFTYCKGDHPRGLGFYDLHTRMGAVPLPRSEFQRTLVKGLDASVITIHFKKRLVSYVQSSTVTGGEAGLVTLHFQDDTTATCDALIGADGLHSATRQKMYREIAEEVKVQDPTRAEELLGMKDFAWSGSVAYRGVISSEELKAIAPDHRGLTRSMIYLGKDKNVIVLPMSGGRLINVAAVYTELDKEGITFQGDTVMNRPQHEMLDKFKGWEIEVIQALQCIKEPSRWAINNLKGLPTFNHGRVALMGDAAHAMTPFQGSGAGQAIEDAYVLASLLAHPLTTLRTLSTALDVYSAIRQPIANDVMRRSYEHGQLYQFNHAEFRDLDVANPPVERLKGLGCAIADIWRWVWTTDPEDDRLKAVAVLVKRLSADQCV